jgi:hypothetical protein
MTYLWSSISAVGAVAAESHRRKGGRTMIDENYLTPAAPEVASVPRSGDRARRIALVQPVTTKVA